MASLKDRLKEILLRDNLVSPDDFEQALNEQRDSGGDLGQILIKHDMVSEESLAQALSESLGLPVINISRLQIDPDILKTIPKEVAEKYRIMPVSLLGDIFTVAMIDPLNIFAIDSIKTLTGYTINPIIARHNDLMQAIEKNYAEEVEEELEVEDESRSETFDDIMEDIHDTEDLELVRDSMDDDKPEELADEAPIIKLTDTIIQQAVMAKASDVFIEPLEKCVRVRYRIDGTIREIDRMAKALHFPIISRIKIISNLDISEHRLPQDGRFKTIITRGRAVDFRVNVLPTALGEKVVLRILDQSDKSSLDVEKLGFEESDLKRLKKTAAKPHGLILACGPTGSGKTTTLYSILKYVDTPGKNIVTVEDPVEYQMPGLNQVNIKPTMGLTFASSLRSILRQDPDVIMIGEIRDADTLNIAVKAALTGHLVLSSLHTTTAAGSVIRMINMGVEPFLITSSLLAIIAQRLVRRVCPHCGERYEVPADVAKKVGLLRVAKKDKIEIFRPKGCKECFNTGYRGRVGISEVLTLSPKVSEFILSRAGEVEIKQAARKEGMLTMREDALIKAVNGLTTLEEVLRITAPDEDLNENV